MPGIRTQSVASMLIAEMGCMYRTKGISLYQGIQALYEKYGFFKRGLLQRHSLGPGGQGKDEFHHGRSEKGPS